MKILAIENAIFNVSKGEKPKLAFYPDSSLLRNNDDFYIPNLSNTITASLGFYIKFSKIGKCIEPQFAERYYKEFGVAINFFANNGELDIERGFDKSLATSNSVLNINELNQELTFSINNTDRTFSLSDAINTINNIISEASQYFTIKIGDIFYFPLTEQNQTIKITDSFNVSIKKENLLSFVVK